MTCNPRFRILYVDDNADCSMMLSTFLEESSIETQAASTAAQALAMSEAERFDLYLLEAWLPDVDGFELCRRLRAAQPKAPILFFSAAAYDADEKRGIEAGAQAYVNKPDVERLLKTITSFVPPAKYATASA